MEKMEQLARTSGHRTYKRLDKSLEYPRSNVRTNFSRRISRLPFPESQQIFRCSSISGTASTRTNEPRV